MPGVHRDGANRFFLQCSHCHLVSRAFDFVDQLMANTEDWWRFSDDFVICPICLQKQGEELTGGMWTRTRPTSWERIMGDNVV